MADDSDSEPQATAPPPAESDGAGGEEVAEHPLQNVWTVWEVRGPSRGARPRD